jgi:hypothetical protein
MKECSGQMMLLLMKSVCFCVKCRQHHHHHQRQQQGVAHFLAYEVLMDIGSFSWLSDFWANMT